MLVDQLRASSLRGRQKECLRFPGNGVRFSSGCHGPTNGGDHEINLAKGPLCRLGVIEEHGTMTDGAYSPGTRHTQARNWSRQSDSRSNCRPLKS